jgi:hypothetical protein
MLLHIIFNVAVHTFLMLQYMFFRCCSTCFRYCSIYFFDIAVHIFRCCSPYFSMLPCMFFNVALYIFSMLHYLQPDIALYGFFHMFCNVAIEVFHVLLGLGRVRGTWCIRERGTRARWRTKDRGESRSISFRARGRAGSVRNRHPNALAGGR